MHARSIFVVGVIALSIALVYVWSGSAAYGVNLNALPPSNLLTSQAYSIDSAGDVFGIAQDAQNHYYAVEWIVPEPASMFLPLGCCFAFLRRPQRSR